MHAPQQTVYPNADDPRSCKLSLCSHYQEFPFSIYLAADFESFLSPWRDNNDDDVGDVGKQARGTEKIIDVHRLSGFCVHRVSRFEDFQTRPYTYSGENPIDVFYDHVLSESRIISDILARDVPMHPLTTIEQTSHDATVACHNCKREFTSDNVKTRHHCHVTGNYLFAACNLSLIHI